VEEIEALTEGTFEREAKEKDPGTKEGREEGRYGFVLGDLGNGARARKATSQSLGRPIPGDRKGRKYNWSTLFGRNWHEEAISKENTFGKKAGWRTFVDRRQTRLQTSKHEHSQQLFVGKGVVQGWVRDGRGHVIQYKGRKVGRAPEKLSYEFIQFETHWHSYARKRR